MTDCSPVAVFYLLSLRLELEGLITRAMREEYRARIKGAAKDARAEIAQAVINELNSLTCPGGSA